MKKTSQALLQEGVATLIVAPNGKVLEVADYNTENGAAIQLWDYEGEPWQQWLFEEAGENEYRIVNRFTGKCMDLALGGLTEGTWVHQWQRTGGATQKWALETERSGRVRIRNVLAGKCIDLVAMNTKNGARAQIWLDVQGGNQEWLLKRVDDAAPVKEAEPPEKERKGPTAAQRKHKNDLVAKINSAGHTEKTAKGTRSKTKKKEG